MRNAKIYDILLVQPPAFGEFCPPLGLATLSAYLKQNQLNSKVVDFNIGFFRSVKKKLAYTWKNSTAEDCWTDLPTYTRVIQPHFKQYAQRIVREIVQSGVSVVGISVLNTSFFPTVDLIQIINEFFNKDIKIILGGPRMNFTEGGMFLSQLGVAGVFCGEGELGLTEWLLRKKSEKKSLLKV